MLESLAIRPLFPVLMGIELPLYLLILAGIVRYRLQSPQLPTIKADNAPMVSCIITCYSEGEAVQRTVEGLVNQIYAGPIEILAVVDGAERNHETLSALQQVRPQLPLSSRRALKIIPKWQRGGRVSSLNTGLSLSRGEIVMALDGDTSFDNDMVATAVRHFSNPNVIALTGTLRVRNRQQALCPKLQALEYLIGLVATRTGLGAYNVINNVSGAFGVFRRNALIRVGGWECGTAEDLDMTLRLKRHFGRHPHYRIGFAPTAIGHTDAPATFTELLKQRLRWDGDLYYMYARKHRSALSPAIMGWPNTIATIWYGLLHQVVLPFAIALYLLYLAVVYPPVTVAIGLGVVYLIYLLITLVMTVTALALLSERRKADLPLLLLIPLYPLYRGLMRLWSVFAILAEIVLDQHKDSNMAPWWVLKRSQY